MLNALNGNFTDDSSKSLGLDHKSQAGSVTAPRRPSTGGIDAYLRESEEAHVRVTRELREKRRRDLVAQGMTIRQAKEREQYEYEHPDAPKEIRDYEGSKVREIENLMGLRDHDVKGGSSSKSKFKTRKKGTRVCPNCHIESCGCGPMIGRPFEDGRSEHLNAKVRLNAKEAISDEKIAPGLIIQAVVDRAQELGMTIRDYLDLIGAKDIDDAARRLRENGKAAAA